MKKESAVKKANVALWGALANADRRVKWDVQDLAEKKVNVARWVARAPKVNAVKWVALDRAVNVANAGKKVKPVVHRMFANFANKSFKCAGMVNTTTVADAKPKHKNPQTGILYITF